jgi:hypothetical protein
MSAGELCGGIMHKGPWFQCGRAVLMRAPTNRAEACPGGLGVCWDCSSEVGAFLKAAYDARAVRMEHRPDEGRDYGPYGPPPE